MRVKYSSHLDTLDPTVKVSVAGIALTPLKTFHTDSRECMYFIQGLKM